MLWQCSKMKRKIEVFSVLIIFVIGWQVADANQSAAEFQDIAGTYVLKKKDACASMEVKAEQDSYIVFLSGGGPAFSGAAAAAVCTVRAIGKLKGNTLLANFTAVETDIFSYSKSEAEKDKRKVQIVFSRRGANVVHADTFGYCGLATRLTGFYRRKTVK